MNNSTVLKHIAVIAGLITLIWIIYFGGNDWLMQLQSGRKLRDTLLASSVGAVALVVTYELFARRESDQF